MSFFRISAEETGRNCFFRTEKNRGKNHVFFRFGRNWRTLDEVGLDELGMDKVGMDELALGQSGCGQSGSSPQDLSSRHSGGTSIKIWKKKMGDREHLGGGKK